MCDGRAHGGGKGKGEGGRGGDGGSDRHGGERGTAVGVGDEIGNRTRC